MVHQGDCYLIPVSLHTSNGIVLGPDNVDGVKIKIGNIEQSWPDGPLTFDEQTKKWLFNLKLDDSKKMLGQTLIQAQIKRGPNIMHTKITRREIFRSIIMED